MLYSRCLVEASESSTAAQLHGVQQKLFGGLNMAAHQSTHALPSQKPFKQDVSSDGIRVFSVAVTIQRE